MSILIKGMEMPQETPVLFCVHPDGKVFADIEGGWKEYKAVLVPPHGRLIDARHIDSENDRFFDMSQASEEFDEHASAYAYSLIANILANTPTIIPAEEE